MESKVVGKIIIEKSFEEDAVELTKTLEKGDFEEVFQKEGKYLDDLVSIVENKASSGEGFVVTYSIIVKKEEL